MNSGGTVKMSTGFGVNAPGQRNPWLGQVGEIGGGIAGAAFGGPFGAIGGAMAGQGIGDVMGNMIAGRDAYNGTQGNFFDNLNPASRYGAMSPVGQFEGLKDTVSGFLGGNKAPTQQPMTQIGSFPIPAHYAQGGIVSGHHDLMANVVAEAKAALLGEHPHPDQAIERLVEMGGPEALHALKAQLNIGGGAVEGAGDGMADLVPGSIDGHQPVQLATDEHVIPADVVSHLGNGSSTHGHRLLKEMTARIRQDRTGTDKQAPRVDGSSYLPG
jgi:hypothetical protein